MTLTGTTFVTQSNVLSDQHKVFAKCNVLYWITAEFRRHQLVTKQVSHPVEITKLSSALQVRASTTHAADYLECTAVPGSWSVIRKSWPVRSRKASIPTLSFRVPSELGKLAAKDSEKGTSYQSMTIPIMVSLTVPPHSATDPLHDATIQGGVQDVEVTAKWHTSKIFSTGSLRHPASARRHQPWIYKSTVVEQKSVLCFPPFYHEVNQYRRQAEDPFVYSAMVSLRLVLPDTIASPSVSTDLLSISYRLELLISYKPPSRSSLGLAACTAKMKIPLVVHLA